MPRLFLLLAILIALVVYVACHVWAIVPLPRWGGSHRRGNTVYHVSS